MAKVDRVVPGQEGQRQGGGQQRRQHRGQWPAARPRPTAPQPEEADQGQQQSVGVLDDDGRAQGETQQRVPRPAGQLPLGQQQGQRRRQDDQEAGQGVGVEDGAVLPVRRAQGEEEDGRQRRRPAHVEIAQQPKQQRRRPRPGQHRQQQHVGQPRVARVVPRRHAGSLPLWGRVRERVFRPLALRERVRERACRPLALRERVRERVCRPLAPRERVGERVCRPLALWERVGERVYRPLALRERVGERVCRPLALRERVGERVCRQQPTQPIERNRRHRRPRRPVAEQPPIGRDGHVVPLGKVVELVERESAILDHRPQQRVVAAVVATRYAGQRDEVDQRQPDKQRRGHEPVGAVEGGWGRGGRSGRRRGHQGDFSRKGAGGRLATG